MKTLAVCLYGFNRNSVNLKNFKSEIKNKWFPNDDLDIHVYYSTYNTENENEKEPLNKNRVLQSFNKFGINNVNIYSSDYNELDFLKKIKSVCSTYSHEIDYFHRNLSMYTRIADAIKQVPENTDYIMLTRLQYGLDTLTYKPYNVVKNVHENMIYNIARYDKRNGDNFPLTDSHCVFGTFKSMSVLKTLHEYYLHFLNTNELYYRNIHYYFSYFLKQYNFTLLLNTLLVNHPRRLGNKIHVMEVANDNNFRQRIEHDFNSL